MINPLAMNEFITVVMQVRKLIIHNELLELLEFVIVYKLSMLVMLLQIYKATNDLQNY